MLGLGWARSSDYRCLGGDVWGHLNWHRASFEMKDGNVRAHGMDDRDDVHVDGDSHLSLFLPPHKSKLSVGLSRISVDLFFAKLSF